MVKQGEMLMMTVEELIDLVKQAGRDGAREAIDSLNTDGLLGPQKAAAFLDMEYETFRKLKDRRDNPCPHSGKGKGARYDRKDLLAWHKSLRF